MSESGPDSDTKSVSEQPNYVGSHSGSVKSGDFGRVNLRACCSLNDNEKYFLLKCHFLFRTYLTISLFFNVFSE